MIRFLLSFFCFLFSLQLFAQQTDIVDFLKVRAYFEADYPSKSVKGDFDIDFKIIKKNRLHLFRCSKCQNL